jgi:hypothetical protein
VGGLVATCIFEVKGPFPIPYSQHRGSKRIETKHAEESWKQSEPSKLAARYGCYVFAVKTGRGTLPWYVGQTTTGFRKECFDRDKREKYNTVIFDRKGTPVLFFLVAPSGSGPRNKKAVGDLEVFMIGQAKSRNPHILNRTGTSDFCWDIRGVYGGGSGRRSQAAKDFLAMMEPDTLVDE